MCRLRPLTFLAAVVAAGWPADGLRTANGLGVDQRRRRVAGAAFDLADLFAQGAVQLVEGAVAGPDREVVLDQRRGWEVDWQRVPLAAGARHISDRVDHVPTGIAHRPSADAGPGAADRHQRRQNPPLGVGSVRGVCAWPPGRQVLTGAGQHRCALPGQDMDTHGRVFESGVVGRYCPSSKTHLFDQPDTPRRPNQIDDHIRRRPRTRSFTRPLIIVFSLSHVRAQCRPGSRTARVNTHVPAPVDTVAQQSSRRRRSSCPNQKVARAVMIARSRPPLPAGHEGADPL
jgi:hypothetical protein